MAEDQGRQVKEQQPIERLNGQPDSTEQNYQTLKILARTAAQEFDELKLRCEEYYTKFQAEHEKYLKAKADLDRLKNISSLALDEYESLQRKYNVEAECRDKAVEIASKVVNQNKQLKRQSQMFLTQISGLSGEGLSLADLQAVDVDIGEDSHSDSIIAQLQEEIKEQREKIENLKSKLKDTKNELMISQEGFDQEKKAHLTTRKKLGVNEKQLKQLNRVSVMALEEFNHLQVKYDVEAQCRAEAEKIAAESKRTDEELRRKRLILKEAADQDERLAKAFEEITKLNKQIEEERREKEEKIKEMEEELLSSKDGEYLKGIKNKLELAQEEVENLENQLIESEKKVKEAEHRVSVLQESLDDAKKSFPPPPPTPPAPPPPPPPPGVMKKFKNIMGKKKKGEGLKRKSKPDDPLANAMKEMMDRINSGKVQLKPVQRPQRQSESDDDNSAMSELGSLLSTIKKSPSIDDLLDRSPTKTSAGSCEWSTIKLRKRSDHALPKQPSNNASEEGELQKVLRKPRSHSVGDLVDEKPKVQDEATSELRKILERKKAQSERAVKGDSDSSPEKQTFGGSSPEKKTFGDSSPEKQTFGGSSPEKNTFGDSSPEKQTFGGSSPEKKTFGDSSPEKQTFGGSSPEKQTSE